MRACARTWALAPFHLFADYVIFVQILEALGAYLLKGILRGPGKKCTTSVSVKLGMMVYKESVPFHIHPSFMVGCGGHHLDVMVRGFCGWMVFPCREEDYGYHKTYMEYMKKTGPANMPLWI